MEKNRFYQIKGIDDKNYTLIGTNGEEITLPINKVDDSAKVFTIQDAKDGDILACESGWTCIFKSLDHEHKNFSSYCFMDNTGWFNERGSEAHTLDKKFMECYNGDIHPATKKQRELLFQKMHEAGYMWDSENKQLLSLKAEPSEQKPAEEYNGEDYGIDSLYHAQRILEKTLGEVEGYQSDDGILEHKCAITAVKKLREQKSAEWCEEDKEAIDMAIIALEDMYDPDQPESTYAGNKLPFDKAAERLKSLRPQKQWKPSEEQLKRL